MANAVGEPTFWTVALADFDTLGYDLTWNLSISESIFSSDTFALRPGDPPSPPVSRADDGDYRVQVTGNNVNNLTKAWSCVGDDSTTPQTSTANFFQVFTTVDDTTMDCTLSMSNPTPSRIVIAHEYPDGSAATATYDIVYDNSTGGSPGSGGTLADGQSTSLPTWQGAPLQITTSGVPGAQLDDVVCSNGAETDFFVSWNRFTGIADVSGFRMVADDVTTCTFVYASLGTLTVVEDSEPAAPAADYEITDPAAVIVGSTVFALADGQSETLTIDPTRDARLERSPVAEYGLQGFECLRVLEGGGTAPANVVSSSFSEFGIASVRVDIPAGHDVVCTFTSTLAGPPSVFIDDEVLIVDPTAFADLDVEITEAGSGVVIDTVTLGSSGGVTVDLPDRGSYTLTVLNPQGLEITWSCGTQTGDATTIDVLLGESPGCTVTADENPPGGPGSLTIEKVSSPDPTRFYAIGVSRGAYPIDRDAISESTPFTVTDLGSGLYTVTETTAFDTQLTAVDCGVGTSAITRVPTSVDGLTRWLNSFDVEVGIFPVTCELTNELVAEPTAIEIFVGVDPSDGTESTTFTLEPASAAVAGSATSVTVTGGGFVTFFAENDTPVTVTQTALDGYVTTSSCGAGAASERLDQTFTTPVGGGSLFCFFDNIGVAPTVTIETTTDPPAPTASFDYEIVPGAAITSGPATFAQLSGASTTVTIDVFADDPTISQAADPAYDTSVGCYEPATEPGPTLVSGTSVVPALRPGAEVVCVFSNSAPTPTVDVTLNAFATTGPVELGDRFTFDVELSGPGLQGAVGGTRDLSLATGDLETVQIDEGSALTIDATGPLAGADGFEYSIDCGVYFEVNQPVTISPAVPIECSLTFEARTITVEKLVDPGVIGGFDEFDIDVDPAIDPVGGLTFLDGDRETFVAALERTVTVTELDPGPYDPSIACTTVTFGGITLPSTGPFGGDSVVVPDDRESYECQVVNTAPLVTIFDVTVESELDLGAVPIPSGFPGIDVDFDGDLAGEVRGATADLPPQLRGPASPAGVSPTPSSARRGASLGGASGLLDTVTVPPNGSVSVGVVGGGDLTIAAGAGSEPFATVLSCPGGVTNPDGSVSLTAVGGPITCTMTNTAANLTLAHRVVGPTAETSWPFTISGVVAGPAAPALGNGTSATVAVAVDSVVTAVQVDSKGASSVTNSCGAITTSRAHIPAAGPMYVPQLAAILDTDVSITLGGGERVTCTFVNTYDAVVPTTTPTTTTTTTTTTTPVDPPAPATTEPPTTDTPVTPPTVVTTTTTTTPVPPISTATTVPSVVPFAPPTTSSTTSGPDPTGGDPGPTSTLPSPTTTSTSTSSVPPVPPTTAPGSTADAPPSTDPEATVIITSDGPDDVFVDIGDPIPVDIDCDGETVVLVNGVEQPTIDQIDPAALGLGDHVIEVRCDGETVTEVRAVVFEQDEGAPAGSNMTVVVMFVVMAVGAFLFAPSAATRRRPA